ncbi:procollagen C-endopeptidase enhancer 1-like [Passer montanus]|uniref:procollagen C-endopeptidase enhancer 1-like n=1 Tax=Passer montanus TaxID=9160 RepID=UPI001960C175|nr:procollagen C-endopeptidase enhancer 1-like [Passer montanus]
MSRLGPPLLLLLLGALGPPRAGGQEPPPSPPPPARHNASRPVWPVFPCGGDHHGESGFIASEGFPRHYPPGSNCTWTITVPEGQVATLSFRVFDLEPEPRCRFDALSVFGGHGPAAPLLGRFCGTFRPGALRAPQNRLLLRMESDGGTAGRGFLAWFSAGSPPSHEQQFCGGRLEKPQGSLSTPNWPEENYPPGVSCSWHIVGPPGKVVELRFGKFDVEPDPHCRYDYVAVFEGGARDDARRLGRFCGEETPGPLSVPAVLAGTVRALSRAPEPGWAALSVLGLHKWGAPGVPPPAAGSSLRLQLPCRSCPALRKGSSYLLMGRLAPDGAALLPPDAFVAPYRPQQHPQLLGNLGKRPCRGTP